MTKAPCGWEERSLQPHRAGTANTDCLLGRCQGIFYASACFSSTEHRSQAQKCHLAAVAFSLLLHVPLLRVLYKETTKNKEKLGFP